MVPNFAKYSLIRWQKPSGVGKGNVTRNIPNSANLYSFFMCLSFSGLPFITTLIGFDIVISILI